MTAVFPWSTDDELDAPALNGAIHGGDGSDGALTISSGTTTIDLGGAAIVVKNYSSISITGTGKLAFSNPHAGGTVVVLKCAGNCTITSSSVPAVDLRNIGGAAGTYGTGGSSPTNGSDADNTFASVQDGLSHYGKKGTGAVYATSAGTGGAATSAWNTLWNGSAYLAPGQGGGGGGGGASSLNGTGSNGGAGGRGGGSLIMEVNGNVDITSTINLSGADGTAGTNTSTSYDFDGIGAGGGGGGGGSGSFRLTYVGTLTFSGSIVVTGGAYGAGGTASTGSTGGSSGQQGYGGGGGSGGASAKAGGDAGTNGSSDSNHPSGGQGGKGADGFAVIMPFIP